MQKEQIQMLTLFGRRTEGNKAGYKVTWGIS
jgi:hypothetical protein